MTTYTYNIAVDFPNQKVAPSKFSSEIKASSISTATLLNITTVGNTCDVNFSTSLSGADETILNGLVAAHTGIETAIVFHATSKVISDEVQITQDSTWQVLGGVVASPEFFVPALVGVKGRIVGSVKTVGTGVQLKVVEAGASNVDMNSTPYSVSDTSNAWSVVKFLTDVAPRAGDWTYEVHGRLNGASSASMRFSSLTLLEIVTVS